MQITAEIPVCLSPSGGHRHSLNSILREPLTIRIGNSSELFGRTITKSKDLRKLQQNLFYKLPECFVNNQIQRNNSRFFHCIVSFIIVNMSDIRDTRENGSPVRSTDGGDGTESSSELTVQRISAVNVSGLRRQSHTACMTTSSLSTVYTSL